MTGDRNKAECRGRVVVVDDDEPTRISIGQMFRLRQYEVVCFERAETALSWPELGHQDCIITDVKMPGMGGEEFLREVVHRYPHCPVIVITGHGDVSMAVRCLKAGAYDFVEKPFGEEVLLAGVKRGVEASRLRREAATLRQRLKEADATETARFGMVGKSAPMEALYRQIELVARAEAPVLIVGETGVGKELVARAIHAQSRRARGPFLPVNAGALPQSMLESELFGHAKGAFTGAERQREGKLVAASGGTLLLDEVESLPLQAQVELLRFLEDGQVVPVGQDRPRQVDVRILATTKVDLHELVHQEKMRADFYHRIMVLTVEVPPLRDRGSEDISLLMSHFLRDAADRNGIGVPSLPDTIVAAMLHYPWPGNVREMRNCLERMVVTAEEGTLGAFDPSQEGCGDRLLSLPITPGRLRDELELAEKNSIVSALKLLDGRIGECACHLGISRRALYERMRKYGLSKEDYRP